MEEKRLIEYLFVNDKIEKLHMDAFRRRDKAQSGAYRKVEDILTNAPTVDAVSVVRCEKCVLHGNCIVEESFALARIENPFCCAGKQKEGADLCE